MPPTPSVLGFVGVRGPILDLLRFFKLVDLEMSCQALWLENDEGSYASSYGLAHFWAHESCIGRHLAPALAGTWLLRKRATGSGIGRHRDLAQAGNWLLHRQAPGSCMGRHLNPALAALSD